jgi:transcriptional regulator GlxA family with amidase domain
MARVDVVVFDGVDELDVVAPFEVLRVAGKLGTDISVNVVALDDRPVVTTQGGLRLGTTAGWSPRDAEVVVVPGGGYASAESDGVRAEMRSGRLPAALHEAARPGLTFASVCTGAMLLAAAGLLRGRPCTTHHRAIADLEAAGGRYVAARVVDDGDLVSSGGVTSGLDLALRLVERLADAATAVAVEKVLEYERRGTVWHAPKGDE